jgi:predicted RNA binding protein YcfA (HicA-like mRNA interferase family)
VKGSEVKQMLRAHKCCFYREGRNHEIWFSPITGKKFQVPRHDNKEVATGTVNNIKRSAGIK